MVDIMTKSKKEIEIVIHGWVGALCSYYHDWHHDESVNHRLYAEMACDLIPHFLKDLGVEKIIVNRVNLVSYDCSGLKEFIEKNHGYLKICLEEVD
jgi:hypothetical protein